MDCRNPLLGPKAANLMVFKAAAPYDAGEPCGAQANAAKYLAAQACFRACERAVLTPGGMGHAKEYHPHLILCCIAEKVLGSPRSN